MERIVSRPGVLSGEPTIAGTRISVRTVLLTHCGYHADMKNILDAHATLTTEDVQAALQYSHEHRDEINQHIAENTEGEDIPYDELG